MMKFLAACGVLILSAISTQAATVASVSSTGNYFYIPGSPSALFNGVGTGQFFYALDVERDYTLSYSFTIDPETPDEAPVTRTGSEALGSVTLTDFFTAPDANGDGAIIGLSDILLDGKYSNLSLAGNSGSFGYFLSLTPAAVQAVLDLFGFDGGAYSSGDFSLSVDLVAAVPLPATLPMLLGGIGGLVLISRKRGKNES